MEIFLLILLVFILVASYLLFNVRAGKKQTDRENRIKWRH